MDNHGNDPVESEILKHDVTLQEREVADAIKNGWASRVLSVLSVSALANLRFYF